MILTDEELALAYRAVLNQSIRPQDKSVVFKYARAIEAAILAKLNSAEPVGYEFQATDGKWCPFIDQRHFDNTKEDGRWPIRAIYTTPQPDRTAELEAALREAREDILSFGNHDWDCKFELSNFADPCSCWHSKSIATIDKVLKP